MSRVKSSVRKINSIFDEVSASSAQSPSAKFWTPWLKPALGYLFAVAGMIWVLHDFQFGLLRGVIANLDWRWIALAIVCDTLSRVCQGIRWRLLLKPKGELSTFRATQAIYAGLFTNEILPMRLGELVRAYLASRWMAVKFVAALPSVVAERLFDGLWLAVGIGLTAMFVPLPRSLLRTINLLGAGVMIAAAGLFYVVLRTPERTTSTRAPRFVASLLEKLLSGLQGMGRTREFYLSLVASVTLPALEALAFWLVMLGCGLHLNFGIGLAVFLIMRVGTAIPNAPANVGSYQFFTVLGLTLFGVDTAVATGFSLVVFALLSLPLLVLGFIAISYDGTSLMKIRREVQPPTNL